jgi:crotonobetainyl-CoA:carnitine CoA-transferase CaiB-like acyl-CoA transferase
MPGPLDGFRIVECSELYSAPIAVMLLAEQGADVIKVEPPPHGDEARQLSNYRNGMAGLYLNANHAKRSIGLNLKTEAGRRLIHELLASADVFVQNWRPGTAERLGLGEADVRRIRPDIVYASVVGFGDDGPYASRRGYDPIFQALTGYVAAQLNPEIPIPDLVRNVVVDKATAYTLAQAITAALLARERGAGGQHVRVTMLDAGLAFFWPDGMLRHSLVGDDVQNPMVPGERYTLSATKDGQIVFWASTAEQMRGTLRAVGRDDLAESPRHQGRALIEPDNMQERATAVAEGLARMTTEEAYRAMVALEVPVAPILSQAEVLVDPQITHNGTVVEATHPVYGRYRRVRPAARFSGTPTPETPPASLYSADADEVLEELGYDARARARLRADGVVPG